MEICSLLVTLTGAGCIIIASVRFILTYLFRHIMSPQEQLWSWEETTEDPFHKTASRIALYKPHRSWWFIGGCTFGLVILGLILLAFGSLLDPATFLAA